MGLTPSDINQMSVWEYMACSDGWNLNHDPKSRRAGAGDISEDRLSELGIEGFD